MIQPMERNTVYGWYNTKRIIVFWNVMPCCLVEFADVMEERTSSIFNVESKLSKICLLYYPEDRSNTFFRNIGNPATQEISSDFGQILYWWTAQWRKGNTCLGQLGIFCPHNQHKDENVTGSCPILWIVCLTISEYTASNCRMVDK
jgi:hypothetical protein